jgi:two-component system response regulator NreC
MATNVFIADDHAIFRSGLRALLEKTEGLAVVGEAGDGLETLTKLKKARADVLLLDLSMPGGITGARLAEDVIAEHPAIAVVVLTMHRDEYYLKELLKVGARGFVVKSSPPEQLIAAIHAAARGEFYVDPTVAAHTVSAFIGRPATPRQRRVAQLTPREREVCALLALGHTNAEVAGKLHLSERTVESHRTKIMERLGFESRAELVQFALENGLLHSP